MEPNWTFSYEDPNTAKGQKSFPYETPAGKKFADPTEVLRKLRSFTNNQIDELHNKAYYLTCIQMSKTILTDEGEVPNPDYQQYDPEDQDCRRKFVEGNKAYETISDAVRYAFDLPKFDKNTGLGATEEFIFDLYNRFSDFFTELKKNIGTSQKSSSSTDSHPESK